MSRPASFRYYALFALGVITLATTTLGVWQHFSPLPIGDSWDGTIGFYLRAMQDPWRAFFEQHNEHRLTFSRLIFFPDVRYFGGRNVLSLAANLVLAGALAVTFWRIAIHHRATLSREARFGLAGCVLVFAFSWVQKENFTWGFQSQWFAVYLFALLAFHAIDLCAEAQARGERGKSSGWFIAALASGWLAAYSMSSGVLVFPVLIAQAVYVRLKPRELVLLTAVTVAVWLAYFLDWHKSPSSGDLTTGLSLHPFIALRFVLLYLGAPAFGARLGLVGGYIAGAFALAALAVYGVRALQPGERHPQGLALLVFALFIAGNALLTAGGRLWSGVESALASRYTTASLAGWLALIIFAALNSRSAKQRKRVALVAVLAIVIVASAQRLMLRTDQDQTYARLVAGLALRAHVYDASVTRPLYPFPDVLAAIARDAEAAKLSLFAADQPDYLVPPDAIHASSSCDGAIDDISATTTAGIDRATGWIYAPADSEVPHAVVITDAAGTTLGTGISGAQRDDMRKVYGHRAGYSGWTAFFKAPANGDIRLAGQTATGAYCAVNRVKPMPEPQLPRAG
ncbi:hypothetical protein [Paraburkholderia sp. BCC1884]|uniref:hypothetical protein n=1 Tax=Paraburkholderia sp. BCC1884 TaxID=2562668 RepID=UPI0011835E5D|nr:hypothetical protein [Paraburkholderia sp. BCC1884]